MKNGGITKDTLLESLKQEDSAWKRLKQQVQNLRRDIKKVEKKHQSTKDKKKSE